MNNLLATFRYCKELFFTILTACLLCINTADGLSLHCLTAPLATAFLLSFPTTFLSSFRKIPQILLGEAVVCVCLVDAYCTEFLGTPMTSSLLSAIGQTDWRESREFLSAFMGIYVVLQWRIACLLLLMLLFPCTLLARWCLDCGKHPLVSKIMFAAMTVCLLYEAVPTYKFLQLFNPQHHLQQTEGLIFRNYHTAISTPLHRLAYALYVAGQSAQTLHDIKESTFVADIDSCTATSPHIVLIIGESYNKHHSTLYGYDKNTTPRQKRRMDAGELFVFTDVVTPWNITSNVFLDIFLTQGTRPQSEPRTFPLFPSLFRRGGYFVTFFSNQYLLRDFDKGVTNQTGNFFLADATLSDFLFDFRNERNTKYDMELVQEFAEYKSQHQHSLTLDIIHLIGQHFDYMERHPYDFTPFSGKDYLNLNLSPRERQIIMHYDNATCYNDSVLDCIIELYEDDNAIIVFAADHGEEVYDDLPVHGRLFQTPNKAQAKQEYEIPMWIWCSPSYLCTHQHVIHLIKRAINKPFTTANLSQLLLFLAGIHSQWTNDSLNIISPTYHEQHRIIGGEIDYDGFCFVGT